MAAKKRRKLSSRQWEKFQRHVVYWQVLLGLQDWGITCHLGAAPNDINLQDTPQSTTIAWVSDDFEHHIAMIYLREDILDQGVSLPDIYKAAFHEVCHIMYAPLEHYALAGGPELSVQQEVHRLIRIMENTFYETQKKELVDG